MKPLKITVCRKHLMKGARSSINSCPIALAVKDALITQNVRVTPREMIVNDQAFSLTEAMTEFIGKFDAGRISRRKSKPFSFYLERLCL